MANKRYDQFPAGTYNPTDILLQADPSTGALEKIALGDIPGTGAGEDRTIAAYQELGSAMIAQQLGVSLTNVNASIPMSDNLIRLTPVFIDAATTITGAMMYMTTQGNYTADNYNGIGLYKWDGTDLDLVASSTNDGNIWKAGTGTLITKAFSATYSAAIGMYYVASLYCNSAQVTAPALGWSPTNLGGALVALDFDNNIKLQGQFAGQTSLVTPIAGTSIAAGTGAPYTALY